MANNTIKARIQLKSDTEENWNKAIHFIPLKGEVIIYFTDNTHPFPRLKVGDGTTPVIDLPFVTAEFSGSTVQVNTTNSWNEKTNYIPDAGQIIVYSDRELIDESGTSYSHASFKIGDGTTYLVDLPFFDDHIINHMNDKTIHVSAEDRAFWNNKLNCNNNVIDETLIINRN